MICKSGKAKADFGGGISSLNVLYKIVKIQECKGQFWRRIIIFQFTPSNHPNQTSQRLILMEEYIIQSVLRQPLKDILAHREQREKADFISGIVI